MPSVLLKITGITPEPLALIMVCSQHSTTQVSQPYGNSAFTPSHPEDKGSLGEKMSPEVPEQLYVGVRGLFQSLAAAFKSVHVATASIQLS